MRSIHRRPLSQASLDALASLTTRVTTNADPKKEAARLWDSKPKGPFEEIRGTLGSMATGRSRCMYCEDSLGTDIEHFWPKKDYPAKAFVWDNYLLACSHCNSNLKREHFPLAGGVPELINPADEDPRTHLGLLPNGEYRPRGPKGQPSIDVFGLNDRELPRKLPQGREDTMRKLQLLMLDYDTQIAGGNGEEAAKLKQAMLNEPFAAVFEWIVDISGSPNAMLLLRTGIPEVIARHGIAGW